MIRLLLSLALLFAPTLDLLIAPSHARLHRQIPLGGITGSGTTPTFRFVQDAISETCTAGTATCTFDICTGRGGANPSCIVPTVAGSGWIAVLYSGNNVTISSVTGGGGTWNLCPSSSCHAFDSTVKNVDLAYNLTGTTGTSSFTVNTSGNTSSYFLIGFIEVLPPVGATLSFDTSGTSDSATCTPTCTGVALTLTATDIIVQVSNTGNLPVSGTAWSSPYITDYIGIDGIGLNLTSGTAPTLTQSGTGGNFAAIAFKSSLGTFAAPSTPMSTVQRTVPGGGAAATTCNPGCTLTVPSTGTGNLLFLVGGDGAGSGQKQFSSITGGGTWVIPSGAGTCNADAHLTCAWVLSSSSGVTSISVTMNGTSNSMGFIWTEVARSSGSWTLDAQSQTTNTAQSYPSSAAASCTGANDAVFQAMGSVGGPSSVQYMNQGFNASITNFNALKVSPFSPSMTFLLNTTNCGVVKWAFPAGTPLNSQQFTVAFK